MASTHKKSDNFGAQPQALPASGEPLGVLVKPYASIVHAVGLPHLLRDKEDGWKPIWKAFPSKVSEKPTTRP